MIALYKLLPINISNEHVYLFEAGIGFLDMKQTFAVIKNLINDSPRKMRC